MSRGIPVDPAVERQLKRELESFRMTDSKRTIDSVVTHEQLNNKENAELKSELENSGAECAECEEWESKVGELVEELAESEKKRSKLKAERKVFMNERDNLMDDEAGATKRNTELDSENKELWKAKNKLEAGVQQLSTEIHEAQSRVKQQAVEIRQLSASQRVIQAQFLHRGETIDELQERVDLLEGELQTLRAQYERLERKVRSAFGTHGKHVPTTAEDDRSNDCHDLPPHAAESVNPRSVQGDSDDRNEIVNQLLALQMRLQQHDAARDEQLSLRERDCEKLASDLAKKDKEYSDREAALAENEKQNEEDRIDLESRNEEHHRRFAEFQQMQSELARKEDIFSQKELIRSQAQAQIDRIHDDCTKRIAQLGEDGMHAGSLESSNDSAAYATPVESDVDPDEQLTGQLFDDASVVDSAVSGDEDRR